MKTTRPSFEEEIMLWKRGVRFVIGIDEVGRGAFAGPSSHLVLYLIRSLLQGVSLRRSMIQNSCHRLPEEN